MRTHTIRIVGGDYRRTPITVVGAAHLRPTPDRVRETLFNWLQHLWSGRFDDKSVLDLFAGSGALGFEAASRGAAFVQMVENHRTAVSALRALRDKLGATCVRIHAGDAESVLQRAHARFDLILLDPPFAQDWFGRLWGKLPARLNPAGLVYAEAPEPIAVPEGFTRLRQGRAGQVHFHLFQHTAACDAVLPFATQRDAAHS